MVGACEMSTNLADAIRPDPFHESAATANTEPAGYRNLQAKIARKSATVAVCGMGYVGLPLSSAISEQGFSVVGLDIDQEKVDKLNGGHSYIRHIPPATVQAMLKNGRFRASSDFGQIANTDVVAVCVPTPLNRYREPDLSYVTATAKVIARHARPGQLIILESTTYPGTTVEILGPIFAECGLTPGQDIFLAFSPEREDPGNPDYHTTTIPKIVGGQGPFALELAAAFYRSFIKTVIPVSSPGTAEAVKLTENIFRAVNIALVNELKVIYSKMGIDIWEVINAAKTKPFGFMPFYPGPGLGGHCIPIDPFYLTWKAREFDITTRFIELAGQINAAMPQYVITRLADELDRRFRKGLNGAQILLLGLAYKKNVDDMRESPTLKLMQLLEARGAWVDYFDPYIPEIPNTREHPEFAGRKSIPFDPSTLAQYDAALIATDHDSVDYQTLVDRSRLVIDARNACERFSVKSEKVAKA
jgi:UDP-N-acetyl-D-glucosamine dehydrogenase